jgi:hypothetical protein
VKLKLGDNGGEGKEVKWRWDGIGRRMFDTGEQIPERRLYLVVERHG